MDCKECHSQLNAFLDQELDGEAAKFLSEHLDECKPCFSRSELESAFKKTLSARRDGHPLPDGLRERLREALDREDHARRPSGSPIPGSTTPGGFFSSAVFWAATGAALLGLGLLAPRVLSSTPEPSRAVANPAQVHGRLTCLRCQVSRLAPAPGLEELASLEAGAPSLDHGLLHVMDDDGRLWELVADGPEAVLLADHSHAGHEATVFGTVLPEMHAIKVARVRF